MSKASKVVEESVEKVVAQAEAWRKSGPDTQIEHISRSTVFGIEVECFVPVEYREGPHRTDMSKAYTKLADAVLKQKVSRIDLATHLDLNPEILDDALEDINKEKLVRFLRSLSEADYYRAGSIARLARELGESVSSVFDRPGAQALVTSKFPDWRWKYDTSVSGSQDEVVSPKLKGKSGLIEVASVLRTLSNCGFSVDNSCGGHTSLSFRNGAGYYTAPLSLFILWGSLEPKLKELIPGFRGNINTAKWVSKKFNMRQLISSVENTKAKTILNGMDTNPTEKYQALSLRSFDNDRVEFRVWEGSLDYTQWAAQIGFGEFVLQEAANLSRALAKIRKEYVQKNTKDPLVERVITNAQFQEWGTSETCECDLCREVIAEYPEDWREYQKSITQILGRNRWVPDGHDTEHDL